MSLRDRDLDPVADDDPTRPIEIPRLGRYELHQRVGYGGMAEVFLACETGAAGLDRWVAIKKIHPGLARQRRFVEMLLDEARIAARIAHPNVAQVLDLGEEAGIPYIVMEFLHGQPLSAVIARSLEVDGGPDVDCMARIVAQAAEGAHAAHELRDRSGRPLGIVHRDLSPHNVFVTYDGAVKVVDFGIAKAKGRATMTEPGTLKGKFSYMSPEQARGAPLDRRSDVYALGLVLYEATTGHRVYAGEDLVVLARVQASQIDPPSRVRRGYPSGLDAIVLAALARDPKDRTPTARELGQALDRLLVSRQAPTGPAEIAALMLRLFPEPSRNRVGQPAGATPAGTASAPFPAPAGTRTRSAPERRPPRRGRTAAIVAGLAIALLVGGAVVQMTRGTRAGTSASASVRTSTSSSTSTTTTTTTSTTAGGAPTSPSPSPSPSTGSEIEPEPEPEPEPEGPDPAPAPARPSPRPRVPRAAPAATADEGVGTGTLDVRSEPWANVSVDGRRQQATPVVALPLPAGPHVVVLQTEDGRTKRTRIVVTAGRPTRLNVRFE